MQPQCDRGVQPWRTKHATLALHLSLLSLIVLSLVFLIEV